MKTVVVGGGSWGTAFAGVLAQAGHTVELACRDPRAVSELRERRENRRYLPGIILPPNVRVATDDEFLAEPHRHRRVQPAAARHPRHA